MYFTKEDLEYIENYLKLKAHRDTDFELLSASQIDKQDAIFAIVQNNVNYKVKFADLITGLSPLQLYDNYQNLPEEGSDGLIYITKNNNTPYIWYDDQYHTTIPYASPTSVGGLKINNYIGPGSWDTSAFSIFPLVLGSGGYYDGIGFTLIPVAGHTDHDYGLISVQDLKKLNNTPQLNAVGKIPAQYLPSYVDNVQVYDSQSDLPEQGHEGTIYITRDTNNQYRWSAEDESYILISSSMQNKIVHADYTYEEPLYEDIYEVTDSDNVHWHFGADGWEIQVLKATTIRDGLMSKEDKQKLDSVSPDANDYELCAEFKDEETQGADNDCTPENLKFGNGLSGNLQVESDYERLTVNLSLLGDSPEYEAERIAFPIVDKYNGEEVCRINIDYATEYDGGLITASDKGHLDILHNVGVVDNLQGSISNISIILTDVTSQTHFTIGSIYTDGTVSLLSNALAGKIAAGLVRVTLRFNIDVRLPNAPLLYQGFMYTNQLGEFAFVLSEASIIKGNPVYLTAVSINDLVEGGQLILKGWY